ncbi:hypothetical protein ACFP63_08575 [Oerskovia jenensis]|uniref:Uncharacterized protein n=1 Tax=Oerskovia jenensis TaxID=162169 RepID=A0ABS2LI66_9CELL|nr:hypothetical protein [Oerskovia jenensis]MBM7480105.1 hypothetical protein [Oerskovia jenensis]
MSRPTGNTSFPKRARTLSPKQYGRDVTTPETPTPVRAWIVTMEGDELEIDADAIAWTKRAVHISYIDRFERPDTAWVWAGAVVRR